MVKRRGILVIVLLLASIVLLGCTKQEVVKQPAQEEKTEIVETPPETVGLKPVQDVRKPNEETCTNLWTPLQKSIEPRKIEVTFVPETSFTEAEEILEAQGAAGDSADLMLPGQTDESIFAMTNKMKATTAAGKEIETACKILQDAKVKDATLILAKQK